ncbi:MAG: MMPL family transporter [Pseudomonadota bacterium]|nr:MMPL family transporter [Pseudomonadota bacterium]
MNSAFHRLGLYIGAHPKRFLAAWVVIIAFGVWGGGRFPNAAQGGTAGLYGSQSEAVSDALRSEFNNPFLDPLIVVIASPKYSADDEQFLAWDRDAARALRQLPQVKGVAAYSDRHEPQLRSSDGHQTTLLMGLSATDVPAQQRAIPKVREAIAPLRTRLLELDPHSVIAVTGDPAVSYDINTSSAEGGDRAEKRALPLTLAILVLAFGTLIAAVLPFLMGLATTMVSLGLAFLLAHLMPVSNLLGNVVTMIGLAVGIDYSLLMVKDYRERLLHAPVKEAVAAAVAEAGSIILWSGATVAIGLLGLLFSPILETRSVGIGGALVVLVSILAALTLLPACLALLGNAVDKWPIIRRPKTAKAHGKTYWARLGQWILRRPLRTLIVSGGVVALLGLPVLGAHSGFAHERWFLPRGLESRTGADMLAAQRYGNADLLIQALVRTTDRQPILANAHMPQLDEYSMRLENDPRIAHVASPLASKAGSSQRPLLLSNDGRAALFEITPAMTLSADVIQQLARDLATVVPRGPFTVAIGGAPAYHNDFSEKMWSSFPKVFGFVMITTLVLLFSAFRSFVLPIKAVIANFMAIAAGYGVVVAIFQFGWLHGLVGLEHPFASIPLEVPLMIFCLSFGLSMDYELFLLFHIQREYLKHGDNNRATVAGLAAVAPVITGAGLIMTVVFGAFASADLPTLKMIGVGLCVAVLVDATLIRAFVVPAFMSVAGRWNWYPGRPPTGEARHGPPPPSRLQ